MIDVDFLLGEAVHCKLHFLRISATLVLKRERGVETWKTGLISLIILDPL